MSIEKDAPEVATTAVADILASVQQATVIRPGDTLVLTLRGDGWTTEHVDMAKKWFAERHVEVCFVVGASDMAVIRPEPTP